MLPEFSLKVCSLWHLSVFFCARICRHCLSRTQKSSGHDISHAELIWTPTRSPRKRKNESWNQQIIQISNMKKRKQDETKLKALVCFVASFDLETVSFQNWLIEIRLRYVSRVNPVQCVPGTEQEKLGRPRRNRNLRSPEQECRTIFVGNLPNEVEKKVSIQVFVISMVQWRSLEKSFQISTTRYTIYTRFTLCHSPTATYRSAPNEYLSLICLSECCKNVSEVRQDRICASQKRCEYFRHRQLKRSSRLSAEVSNRLKNTSPGVGISDNGLMPLVFAQLCNFFQAPADIKLPKKVVVITWVCLRSCGVALVSEAEGRFWCTDIFLRWWSNKPVWTLTTNWAIRNWTNFLCSWCCVVLLMLQIAIRS